MKKQQWITAGVAIFLVAGLFFLRTTPPKKNGTVAESTHDHENSNSENSFSIDSVLTEAKKHLKSDQIARINSLENSITRGDLKMQQLHIYHQLASFWGDSTGNFDLFAWYEAEGARLENSEKSLTFAAHLFLDDLQSDDQFQRKLWKALQAKDLFERSLKINPENDSSKVGLGATYLFGNISATPMEGILKIREVIEKDSTNIYAQLMLAKGSLISGQYDKAISRLLLINRLQANNLEAVLLLADLYERTGDKDNAVFWYEKSLPLIPQKEMKTAVEKRVQDLRK
ncbi:MAG TPA: hypothetical protein PKC72_04480 [Chitinophagaceae bacterium]|nr:hypothetical protein [Chitinophagaceae bacterium]